MFGHDETDKFLGKEGREKEGRKEERKKKTKTGRIPTMTLINFSQRIQIIHSFFPEKKSETIRNTTEKKREDPGTVFVT